MEDVMGAFRPFLYGVILLAIAVLGAPLQAQAQQSQSLPQARIVVIGEGSVSVAPDYAQITCGVSTKAKTAKEATDANSKAMSAVTAALLSSGIEQKDIQTTRFSVQPVYVQPPNAEAKLSGFTVTNQVGVTIRQIAKLGDILDRLLTAGATDIGNIEFLRAEPSKALDQARQAAIADARRKAEIYARASDLALGRVAWITEDAAHAPPMPFGGMRAAVAAAPVPVAAGEDTLLVRITVGFDIAP
jgi:uncharacterized protein YggE